MIYALIQNDQVVAYPYSLTTFKTDNPTVCLPEDPTEAQLNEQGIYEVLPTPQPSYDWITQSCNQLDPHKEGNLWYQTWEVTENTPEQIQYNKDQLAQQNKATGKQLLTDTDWTAIPSVADPLQSTPYLMNQNEFFVYRSAVRDIVLNPTYDAVFPVEPVEVWSS